MKSLNFVIFILSVRISTTSANDDDYSWNLKKNRLIMAKPEEYKKNGVNVCIKKTATKKSSLRILKPFSFSLLAFFIFGATTFFILFFCLVNCVFTFVFCSICFGFDKIAIKNKNQVLLFIFVHYDRSHWSGRSQMKCAFCKLTRRKCVNEYVCVLRIEIYLNV